MVDWIKKNKDWLSAIGGLSVFIVALSVLGVLFQGGDKKTEEVAEEIQVIEKVNLTIEPDTGEEPSSAPQTASFFLKPSPAELMGKFTEMDSHQFKAEAKKLPGLRIMWPTYFFSILHDEAGIATLLLDTTEDGFGVTISCNVNSADNPKIQQLQRGEKLWIAGEIVGVDTDGIGQIFITAEHVRFAGDENWPQALNEQAKEEKK